MTEQYKWTQAEKIIARRIFDRAYKKECTNILNKVKEMLSGIENPIKIWDIEEYLNRERIIIEGKYDYRYSVLIIVFGQLVRDGLIEKSDLQGLGQEKIDRIISIGSFNL
jgi:hypothetical protein